MNPFNKLKLPQVTEPEFLSFSLTNSKLAGSHTAAFSLPAGFSCPGAKDCLAWFDREEGKLKTGDQAKYRCFAASIEAAFTNRRQVVDRNMAMLKKAGSAERMAELIDISLPGKYYHRIRVHDDGDFFSQEYFLAWMQVATDNPGRLFYAYTKSLPIWVKHRECVPENFVLTASLGGKWDDHVETYGLRSARVVYHPDEARELGLEIDHDDSLARDPDCGDFALLLHGMQPPGSDASAALKRMRSEGVEYSYGKASKRRAGNPRKNKISKK